MQLLDWATLIPSPFFCIEHALFNDCSFSPQLLTCLFQCTGCQMHSDFVTIPTVFLFRSWPCGLIPGPGLDKPQRCLLQWFLLPTSMLLNLPLSCANPHSETAFSPGGLKFLCSLVFAFVWAKVTEHRSPGEAEEAAAWPAAQLVQHVFLYLRRWWHPHGDRSRRYVLVCWSLRWFSHRLSYQIS